MKKLIFCLLIFPTILLSQDIKSPGEALFYNTSLIDQLSQISPMSINPYTAVFVTSVCSKLGIHNDYVKAHPFYNSWLVVSIFGFLFLFTLIVRPTLASNKFTNVLKLADEYLEDRAVLVINGIIILLPIIASSHSTNDQMVVQTGYFSISFKAVLILFVTTYYLIVVLAVRYFIDLLIFLSPIPLIDSLLEIFKIFLTIVLVFISIYSPILAFTISLIFFIIGLLFYRKAKNYSDKVIYLFIYPVFDLLKDTKKILFDNKQNVISVKVYLVNKTVKFKKGKVLRLTKNNGVFGLEQKRFFRANIFEPLDMRDSNVIQTDFNISIITKNETKLLLNRSFNKHIEFLLKEFDTSTLTDKRVKFEKAKTFLGKVKTLYSKADYLNFKTNFK